MRIHNFVVIIEFSFMVIIVKFMEQVSQMVVLLSICWHSDRILYQVNFSICKYPHEATFHPQTQNNVLNNT